MLRDFLPLDLTNDLVEGLLEQPWSVSALVIILNFLRRDLRLEVSIILTPDNFLLNVHVSFKRNVIIA
tara:strand:+ start:1122 stop:1325 length:204 start_codon:yes stop_codon:yes gene_type:complete